VCEWQWLEVCGTSSKMLVIATETAVKPLRSALGLSPPPIRM
jgi:hypothetical protein